VPFNRFLIRMAQCFTTFPCQYNEPVNCSQLPNVAFFQLAFNDNGLKMMISG